MSLSPLLFIAKLRSCWYTLLQMLTFVLGDSHRGLCPGGLMSVVINMTNRRHSVVQCSAPVHVGSSPDCEAARSQARR